MTIFRDLLYFIFALILLEALICTFVIGGDIINGLLKICFGIDLVKIVRKKVRERKNDKY